MDNGKLIFQVHGQKLAGLWELVRISKPWQFKQDHWLLLRKRGDARARPGSEYDVITALPDTLQQQLATLAAAWRLGLEGVFLKRADSA